MKMMYKSKRILLNMISGLVITAVYITYALGDGAPVTEDIRSWAILILTYIGAIVVASIVIQVIFHIAMAIGISMKEGDCDDVEVERVMNSSMMEDEMDRTISLKASRIAHIFIGIGAFAMFLALALEEPTVIAMHVLLGALVIGSFLEASMCLYYYEKGVGYGQ